MQHSFASHFKQAVTPPNRSRSIQATHSLTFTASHWRIPRHGWVVVTTRIRGPGGTDETTSLVVVQFLIHLRPSSLRIPSTLDVAVELLSIWSTGERWERQRTTLFHAPKNVVFGHMRHNAAYGRFLKAHHRQETQSATEGPRE